VGERIPPTTDAVEAALQRSDTGDRTNVKARSHAIDGLRALAALMVLVSHARALAGGRDETGSSGPFAAGVMLFFCISGYLIAGPFIEALVDGRPLPWLPGYTVRRIARIYPAYIIAFLAVVVVAPPVHGVRLWQYPVHLLLLQSWVPREAEAIFGVAWTLGLEVMFYLTVPLAALALRRRSTTVDVDHLARIMLGAYAFALAWGVVVALAYPAIGTHRVAPEWAIWARGIIVSKLVLFIPGALIALAQTKAASRSVTRRVFGAIVEHRALTIAAMCVLAFVALHLRGSRLVVFADTLAPFTWGAFYSVFLALIVSERVRLRPVWRILAPVGVVSYGVYLWHWVVRLAIARHTDGFVHGGKLAWGIDSIILLGLTLPLAIGSWVLVESTAMHRAAEWARNALTRKQAAAREPGARPVNVLG